MIRESPGKPPTPARVTITIDLFLWVDIARQGNCRYVTAVTIDCDANDGFDSLAFASAKQPHPVAVYRRLV